MVACRDCLVDVSRLFGLALRPSTPVFCCHGETLDTLEAGTRAGSRTWHFSFVPSVFLNGEVPNRVLTARGFSVQSLLTHTSCFSFAVPVLHTPLKVSFFFFAEPVFHT